MKFHLLLVCLEIGIRVLIAKFTFVYFLYGLQQLSVFANHYWQNMILQLWIVCGQVIVVTSESLVKKCEIWLLCNSDEFSAKICSLYASLGASSLQATQCVQKVTIATLDLSLADGVWTFVFFPLTIWDLELGS